MVELKYLTGETALPGDIVEYHGDRGHVEFVVGGLTGDADNDRHFQSTGPGVMVIEPKHFGRVYIIDLEHDEDLVFVSRAPGLKGD